MAPRPLDRLERQGELAADPVGFGNPVTSAEILAGAASIARVELADIATAYAVVPMLPQRRSEFVLASHLEAYRAAAEIGVDLAGFAPGSPAGLDRGFRVG